MNFGRTFKAFRSRNYQLFWFGQFLSQIGTWMQVTALAWLVLALTKSPFALGSVITAQFLPITFLAAFGGVVADRMPKRRLLMITQTVQLAQATVLALLASTGLIRIEYVYVLAIIQGCSIAVDNPTRQAFVVEMVGPEDLPNAIALNSTQLQLSRLVGPALGGLTIAGIGAAGCFYLNAASFLAVIGALAAMNAARFFPGGQPQKGNPVQQVREGFAYAVKTPDIAFIMILLFAIGGFGYNFQVIMPLVAKYVMNTGAIGFGILSSSMAIGSIAATLLVAYLGTATRRTVLTSALAFSALLAVLGLSRWWLVTIPLLLAIGFTSSVFSATSNSRVQLTAQPQLRGRVMGLYFLLFAGMLPLGSLLGGALAQRQGVPAAVAELAGICGVGVLGALVYLRGHQDGLLSDEELRARMAARRSDTVSPAAEPAMASTEPAVAVAARAAG